MFRQISIEALTATDTVFMRVIRDAAAPIASIMISSKNPRLAVVGADHPNLCAIPILGLSIISQESIYQRLVSLLELTLITVPGKWRMYFLAVRERANRRLVRSALGRAMLQAAI
jgi:hypothetical protein